ncbi:autotransporter outer membrane beta-barrel domain-containing protein [Stenotrophomonas sp. C3(2023)]|nr:autotransporter outer membrane beta-barrel domain-containing protein [Stenotrophomonas sp. C3(2023)]
MWASMVVPAASLLTALPSSALAATGNDVWSRLDEPLPRSPGHAYVALQDLALLSLRHGLQQRAGETRLDWRGSQHAAPGAAWVDVREQQVRYRSRSQDGGLRADVRQLTAGAQLLADDSGGHRSLGVIVQRAEGQVRQRSTSKGVPARTTVDVVGLQATWFADPQMQGGWYADGWVQLGRAHQQVTPVDQRPAQRHVATVRGGSLEAGYAYIVRDSGDSRLLLEPQLQVSRVDVRSRERVTFDGMAVAGAAGGLQVRTGLRLHGRSSDAEHAVVQPYAVLNLYRTAEHGARTTRSTEVAAGMQLQLGRRMSAWGEASVQRGSRFDVAAALVGLKINW